MGGMVNRQGRCEGEGMRIERDWKRRREGMGELKLGKGERGEKGACPSDPAADLA